VEEEEEEDKEWEEVVVEEEEEGEEGKEEAVPRPAQRVGVVKQRARPDLPWRGAALRRWCTGAL
jgi:hypothetical protein